MQPSPQNRQAAAVAQMQRQSASANPQQPTSKLMRHDQCEGQLCQFIDELGKTLYDTPDTLTHYPSHVKHDYQDEKGNRVVEMDDGLTEEQVEKTRIAMNLSDEQADHLRRQPVIKKIEIPQSDPEIVLGAMTKARPDLFKKVQQFMVAIVKNVRVADEEATVFKNEGNKTFIAYQNEVAGWGGNPSPSNKAAAQKLWDTAFNNYTQALAKAKTDEMVATLLNNRSTVLFAGKQYRDAALDCNYCLKLNPTYWKALQRRGMAMVKLGYEAVGESDGAYAKKMMEAATTTAAPSSSAAEGTDNAKESTATATTAAVYDLRFELHDTLLHAFQNVSNYADQHEEEEEEGGDKDGAKKEKPTARVLCAATRLSAPSTVVKVSKDEIGIDRDAKRGRFVVSKQKLPAGTTVLIETPYASANYTNTMSKACAFCLRPTRIQYPCAQYRKRGIRARGMFCSSECAAMNFALYGEREVLNIFYQVCPVDALLASRALFRKTKEIAVLVPAAAPAAAEEATDAGATMEKHVKDPATMSTMAALLILATTKEQRAHIAIDSVGDNAYGKEHMDTLCQFSAELFPGLAEAGGRETILTAIAQFYSIFSKPPKKEDMTQAQIDFQKVEAVKAALAKENPELLETNPPAEPQARGGFKMVNDGGVFINTNKATAEEKALVEQFRKTLRQITVNAFHITFQDRVFTSSENHDVAKVILGKALYAMGSLFNHSCDPNCMASFAGNPYGASTQLHIKTIRPVQEGEELTIAYTSAYSASSAVATPIDKFHIHSTRARIGALRSRFGFACTCAACFSEVDEPIPKDKEEYYHKAADYYQKGRRLMREGNFGESVTVLLQSYEIVMRYICPPPAPPQWMLVNTHESLAQSYNLTGNKAKTIEHLKAALTLIIQLYDKHATQIAANLGPLALEGGDHKEQQQQEDNNGAASSSSHPRNHQPERVTSIVPGTPSMLAMSATFLSYPDINVHANRDIIQAFTRLAHIANAFGRAEEEKEKLKREKESSTSSTEEAPAFVSNYTKDAKKFATRAIELLKTFYAESPALDAELLELELVARR